MSSPLASSDVSCSPQGNRGSLPARRFSTPWKKSAFFSTQWKNISPVFHTMENFFPGIPAAILRGGNYGGGGANGAMTR